MDTVAKGEVAEASLNHFISKQDEKRRREEGERLEEEAWQASTRLYNGKRQRAHAWAWVRHYEGLAEAAERNGAEVAARNRAKAAALMAELEGEA